MSNLSKSILCKASGFRTYFFVRNAGLSTQHFSNCFNNALSDLSSEDKNIAVSCLENIEMFLKEHFRVAFGQRIIDQFHNFLAVYMASGGSLSKGLDHFIARKLLWQIQNKNRPKCQSGAKSCEGGYSRSF